MNQHTHPVVEVPSVVRGSWRCAPWWSATRTNQAGAGLLSLLSVAHHHRLNLPVLLSAYADEHQWLYRRRLRLLAQRLSEGTALDTALEQTPGLLTKDQMLELRLSLKSGTYAETVQCLAHPNSDPLDSTIQELALRPLIYAVTMAMGGGVLILFMSFFLLPTIQVMLEELNDERMLQEDALNRLALFRAVVDFVLSVWPLLAILGIGCLVYAFINPDWHRARMLSLGKWLGQHTSRGAELLRLLAMPLRRGRPLPGTISTLARYHYEPSSRRKLLLARNEIEHGVDVWDSLVAAKLIAEPQVVAVRYSESPEVQAWIADRIATAQAEHGRRNRIAKLTFVHPLCVLFMGAIVLGIAYTFLTALRDVLLGQL